MKKVIFILLLVFSSLASLYAGLGDISLVNVGFNGVIGPVGSEGDENGSVLSINVTEPRAGGKAYSYTFETDGSQSMNYFKSVSIKGDEPYTVVIRDAEIQGDINIKVEAAVSVTFEHCIINGRIKIEGPAKVTFCKGLGLNDYTVFNGTDNMTENVVTAPYIDGREMSGGELTITGCRFEHPDQITIDLSKTIGKTGINKVTIGVVNPDAEAPSTPSHDGNNITNLSFDNNSATIDYSHCLRAILLTNNSDLSYFRLGNFIYTKKLVLTGCKASALGESSVLTTTDAPWKNWKAVGYSSIDGSNGNPTELTGLLMSGMSGLPSVFRLENPYIHSLDINTNSAINHLTVAQSCNESLKYINAANCGIKYADVSMVNDSNSYLHLENNSLGTTRSSLSDMFAELTTIQGIQEALKIIQAGGNWTEYPDIDRYCTGTVTWRKNGQTAPYPTMSNKPSTGEPGQIITVIPDEPAGGYKLNKDVPEWELCGICGGDGKIDCPHESEHVEKKNGKWYVEQTCSSCSGNYENCVPCSNPNCEDGYTGVSWYLVDRHQTNVVSGGGPYVSDSLPSTSWYNPGDTVTITEYEAIGGGAYKKFEATYCLQGTECSWCGGDGWMNCPDCMHGIRKVICPGNCDSQGQVRCTNDCTQQGIDYYTVCGYHDEYEAATYQFIWTSWDGVSMLKINGNPITTYYSLGVSLTSSYEKDFTTEWSGIVSNVYLENNQIVYIAGLKTDESKANGITFRIKTCSGISGYIAKCKPCYSSGSPHSQFKYFTNNKTVDGDSARINSDKTYSVSETKAGAKETVTFQIWKPGKGRGPEMYIHPFGDTSQTVGND